VIENDLFIFMRRDVVKGLIFLHKTQHYSCGNLKKNIFVSRKSRTYDDKDFKIRAKLLPSMTESKDFAEDAKQLRKIMEFAISRHSIREVDIPCFELNHYIQLIDSFS
jgi:hypothetical protein